MENISDSTVVLEIEELLRRVCGSPALVDAIINSDSFKTNAAHEFDVFILSNGRIEHNTLLLPAKGTVGKISWRVEIANKDMAGIDEWATMTGWRISCVQTKVFEELTGEFKDINENNKKLTLPYTVLDSIFEKNKAKTEELNAAVLWIKSHNAMIGKIVRDAFKEVG